MELATASSALNDFSSLNFLTHVIFLGLHLPFFVTSISLSVDSKVAIIAFIYFFVCVDIWGERSASLSISKALRPLVNLKSLNDLSIFTYSIINRFIFLKVEFLCVYMKIHSSSCLSETFTL